MWLCCFTVFIPFQSCYYLLYQCLVPNTREALSLLVQHYSVPKDFERSILSGENPRVCNQGILNYLLIMLRKDKNYEKFWQVIKSMIYQSELRRTVEQVQKGIYLCYTCMYTYVHSAMWLRIFIVCMHCDVTHTYV